MSYVGKHIGVDWLLVLPNLGVKREMTEITSVVSNDMGEEALSSLNSSSWFSKLTFREFYNRLPGRPPEANLPQIILGIDPGETTGLALFRKLDLEQAYQVNTSIIEWGVDQYHGLIYKLVQEVVDPNQLIVIVEDYRIYAWKVKEHTWAGLLTPRLIGVLECLCRQYKVRIAKQSAQQGKAFMTDDKLTTWELYKPGLRHGRDAIRHAARFILFGKF